VKLCMGVKVCALSADVSRSAAAQANDMERALSLNSFVEGSGERSRHGCRSERPRAEHIAKRSVEMTRAPVRRGRRRGRRYVSSAERKQM